LSLVPLVRLVPLPFLPLVPVASFVFSYGKIAQFFHTKKQRELCPTRTKFFVQKEEVQKLRKNKGSFVLQGQSSSFCSCAIFPYEKTKEARGTKRKNFVLIGQSFCVSKRVFFSYSPCFCVTFAQKFSMLLTKIKKNSKFAKIFKSLKFKKFYLVLLYIQLLRINRSLFRLYIIIIKSQYLVLFITNHIFYSD